MGLQANVAPVQAAPPRMGLLASALRPEDGTDWVQGLTWRPERCPIDPHGAPSCEPHIKVSSASAELADYTPVDIYLSAECSTSDGRNSLQDAADRVKRQLEAATSYMAAAELWNGAITRRWPDADGPNAFLADGNATDIGGSYASALAGLAALEAAAMDASKGQQVFLHVSPEWVMHLRDAVRREGNLLLTENDNVVVADGGYPGTGSVTAGTAEVQTVTVTGSPTGGTFTLTYQGQTTGPIDFDASTAEVQAALDALPNVFPGDVVVTGSGPYTLTFDEQLGNVPELTADGSGLTGGVAPDVTVATTTPGVAPAGDPAFTAYATGPVQVRLTAVENTAQPAQVVDRTSNRYTVWAARYLAATFDPCLQLSVEVTALSG